jgi:hypothetical protein
MVKLWSITYMFPTDSDMFLRSFDKEPVAHLVVEVKRREYDREEVQKLVTELTEWLAETAPKEGDTS